MAPHAGVDVRCDLMWPPATLRWLCRRSEEHALTRPAGPTHGADAVDRLRADYDATPYTSDAFPQSAPGQLAAIAHVFGLDVPAVSRARVLEIGCAAGGNIIPFAAAHPEALAVGIDLSQVQIDLGRERAQALGLDNLEFVAGDIARTNLTGAFDYIVAHGVYSWVPPDVQEALLAAIGRLLAPNGVAYLSYNTYPGWKAKEVMRDAMLLASGASTTTADKVRDARGMVDFLRGSPVGEMRWRPGAGRAVPRLRRQPHVPRVTVRARPARHADPL